MMLLIAWIFSLSAVSCARHHVNVKLNETGLYWAGQAGQVVDRGRASSLGVEPLFVARYVALFGFLSEMRGSVKERVVSVALGDDGLSRVVTMLRELERKAEVPPCVLVQTMPRAWSRQGHPGRQWVQPVLVHGPEVLPPFARKEDEWRELLARRRSRWRTEGGKRQSRTLLWRGNPHFYDPNTSRPLLVAASTACYARDGDACPIDAAFIPLPRWLGEEASRHIRAHYRIAAGFDFAAFAQSALVGDVAGYAWSARLPKLLASGSLVVRVGNEHLSRTGWSAAGGVGAHEVVEVGFEGAPWSEADLRVIVDQWTADEAWEARWRRVAAAHEWIATSLSLDALTDTWLADLEEATGPTCGGVVADEDGGPTAWHRFVPCSAAPDAASCAAHSLGLGSCTFLNKSQVCAWDPRRSAQADGLPDDRQYLHEGTVEHDARFRA